MAQRIRRDVDPACSKTVALHRREGSVVADDVGYRIRRRHVAPPLRDRRRCTAGSHGARIGHSREVGSGQKCRSAETIGYVRQPAVGDRASGRSAVVGEQLRERGNISVDEVRWKIEVSLERERLPRSNVSGRESGRDVGVEVGSLVAQHLVVHLAWLVVTLNRRGHEGDLSPVTSELPGGQFGQVIDVAASPDRNDVATLGSFGGDVGIEEPSAVDTQGVRDAIRAAFEAHHAAV
jgi:hypothetical protein